MEKNTTSELENMLNDFKFFAKKADEFIKNRKKIQRVKKCNTNIQKKF